MCEDTSGRYSCPVRLFLSHCSLLLHLLSRGEEVPLSLVRPSLLDLGSMEDRGGVERERCSRWPVIALAECFQIRKTVDTHAGLGRAGVIRWLTVSGMA